MPGKKKRKRAAPAAFGGLRRPAADE